MRSLFTYIQVWRFALDTYSEMASCYINVQLFCPDTGGYLDVDIYVAAIHRKEFR